MLLLCGLHGTSNQLLNGRPSVAALQILVFGFPLLLLSYLFALLHVFFGAQADSIVNVGEILVFATFLFSVCFCAANAGRATCRPLEMLRLRQATKGCKSRHAGIPYNKIEVYPVKIPETSRRLS